MELFGSPGDAAAAGCLKDIEQLVLFHTVS